MVGASECGEGLREGKTGFGQEGSEWMAAQVCDATARKEAHTRVIRTEHCSEVGGEMKLESEPGLDSLWRQSS